MFDPVKYLYTSRWQKSRLGLSRIKKLLNALGNPQDDLKFIHVAGTNGKGSVCAYLSQILINAGYTCGLYTSPAIYDFRERIQVNNKSIDDNALHEITYRVKCVADSFPQDDHPTEFELICAVAFLYFKAKKCDLVVCEVGMGGRLDATNVLRSSNVILSIITKISIDHTKILGDNITSIAQEKAGILKQNTPVLTCSQQRSAMEVIKKTCSDKNSQILVYDNSDLDVQKIDLSQESLYRVFWYSSHKYKTQLLALYQPQNASLAIMAAKFLNDCGFKIFQSSIESGVWDAYWPARFQILRKKPYIIIDGGHNVEGAVMLRDSLIDMFGDKKFVFIVGVLKDKCYREMLEIILPYSKKIVTITPPNPRALSADPLAQEAEKFGKSCIAAPSFEYAWDFACKDISSGDVVCAFGSLYSAEKLYKTFKFHNS